MRLPFLILTPSCIFLAYSALRYNEFTFSMFDLTLINIAALAAHISVNSFNEYFDFRSGLDEITTRTPFSGGSGGLIESPHFSKAELSSAIISLSITILIGIFFIIGRGPIILPMGLLGIVIIISYTQWLNRSPLLCHIAPGLAFGPLMIIGTHWLLTQNFNFNVLLISLIPFFLINNLLLLNQLPDIKADTSVGRRTFPIIYGIEKSLKLYLVNNLVAGAIIIWSVSFKYWPLWTLISLLPLVACIIIYRGLYNRIDEISTQQFSNIESYLGLNIAMTLLTPLVLSFTLLLS